MTFNVCKKLRRKALPTQTLGISMLVKSCGGRHYHHRLSEINVCKKFRNKTLPLKTLGNLCLQKAMQASTTIKDSRISMFVKSWGWKHCHHKLLEINIWLIWKNEYLVEEICIEMYEFRGRGVTTKRNIQQNHMAYLIKFLTD